MATTIPKSKTGVASNKADYSIVEGNPQATEVNRLRAEGALAKSDIKTGKSIKAKDALKSPLPVASSSTATSDLQRKLTDYRDILQGMADQKARVEQQNALEKQQADAQKQAEADARMASEKLKIEKQNADTKASLASGGVVGNPLDAYLTGKGQDASIQSKADLAVKQGLVASPMEYRQAVQNGTVADLDNQLVSKLQENTNEIQTGSSYTDQQYGSDVSTLLAMSDKMYDNFIRQTNQIKNGTFPLSASENAILSETQKAFERSKEEQRKSNEGFVGSVKLSGMRRGGEYTDKQYAGEIQQAVSDGIQKIADIDSKAALTMAELQKGFDEENYKIINDQYTAFNNLMKSKGDAIAELHKSAAEHEKFVYQKAKDQKDLEQRAIENEREATKLADNLATNQLQRQKLSLDIQKAKNELADMDMNVVGQDASYPAYYNAVANATIGLPENQRKEITANLNKYLKNGDTESAKELILRTAFQGQTGTQREDSIKRAQAVDSLTTVKSLLNDYVATNGDTGILSGNMQKIQQKLGQEGTPEAAAINNRITQALQIYRGAITGAAWGVREDAEYKQIFPDLTNTNKLNIDIIDSMTNALNANNRIAVSQYIGQSSYDDIFEPDRNVDDYLDSSLGDIENSLSSGDQAIEDWLYSNLPTY